MRHTTMIFCGIALAAFAACASAQTDQSTPTSQSRTEPATPTNSKPANGIGNAGNGLASGMSPDEANRMFSHLDANSDGYVSRDEFMATGDSGQRFPGCDADGDGKLSRAEFVQCSQRPPTTDQQHCVFSRSRRRVTAPIKERGSASYLAEIDLRDGHAPVCAA